MSDSLIELVRGLSASEAQAKGLVKRWAQLS